MRDVIYCSACGKDKDWPRNVRITSDPCDICGSWDAIRKRRIDAIDGVVVDVVKLNNFIHRADMLPGTTEESKVQNPR
jgi:hypothetical protein